MVGAPILGIAFALGAWSLIHRIASRRRASLIDRVQAHVLDFSEGARERRALQRVDPLPVLGSFVTALLYRLERRLPWPHGDNRWELLARRGGVLADAVRVRVGLLGAATAGAVVGALVGVVALDRALPLGFSALAPVLGAAAGWAVRLRCMRAAAVRRANEMIDELPVLVEITVLGISAGEGVLCALRRAAARTHGPLARELDAAIACSDSGETLAAALLTAVGPLPLPDVHRFVDHLVVGLERGTPIVDVLRAHLTELRQAKRRRLIETAGRRDIAMLIPLVFVILPTTVLFAVFPGLAVLGSVP